MTKLIVDASTAAAWLLASQTTSSAVNLLDRISTYTPIAPHVFQWEVGNLLVRQTRRAPGFDLREAFAVLDSFGIAVAPAPGQAEIRSLAGVAAARGLSLFDASYLWLAMAVGGTLASRDGDLLDTANAAGLPVLDLRD